MPGSPLIFLLVAFILPISVWAVIGAADSEGVEKSAVLGPAQRDEEGRFVNLSPRLDRAGPGVLLPFFARRVFTIFAEPSGVPEVEPDATAKMTALFADTAEAPPVVTWVGHATVLVRHDGVTYLGDPNWSNWAGPGGRIGSNRYVDPGVPLESLPELDFVVISHNHYDHLDLPTLERLAALQPDTVFLVPLGNGELLRDSGILNVEELDWTESRQFGSATVHCLPNQHWSTRGLTDERKALWGSWAVTGPERRVYFAGDTGFFPEFATIGETLGPFDLAILPIGAYEPKEMMKYVHLNPEEAVEAGELLKARRSLGMHYGTFNLTDEPVGEPPVRFRAAAKARGWSEDQAWVFRIGETRPF